MTANNPVHVLIMCCTKSHANAKTSIKLYTFFWKSKLCSFTCPNQTQMAASHDNSNEKNDVLSQTSKSRGITNMDVDAAEPLRVHQKVSHESSSSSSLGKLSNNNNNTKAAKTASPDASNSMSTLTLQNYPVWNAPVGTPMYSTTTPYKPLQASVSFASPVCVACCCFPTHFTRVLFFLCLFSSLV